MKVSKVGPLSDCTPEIRDIWPDLPCPDVIDCGVRSCDVGWRKEPDVQERTGRSSGLPSIQWACILG